MNLMLSETIHHIAFRKVVVALVIGCLAGLSIVANAKSMYVIANHHTAQFDAWNISAPGVDPPITYQATYNLTHASDPAGVAVDSDSETLFITSEADNGVELVDAKDMTSLGSSDGPSNLGGIDIDEATDTVYTVKRAADDLYVYDWDPVAKTLTLRSGFPKDLPNCTGAFGLALDSSEGLLYVADSMGSIVRVYDVATLEQVSSFTPSIPPMGIDVDSQRGLVYTTAPDGSCAGGPLGYTLLSKYDVASGVETTVDMGYGGMGIAVDEITGYVYVTGGCSGDVISIWDSDLNPIYTSGVIGNPAGIAIGNASYNPLNLAKNDTVVGQGVYIGQQFAYEITYDNADNAFAATGAVAVDRLPVGLDFVSETLNGVPGTGVYDLVAHTVTWDIGTLAAGYTGGEIEIVVSVNQNASSGTTIYNYCEIDSDQTPLTTVVGGDPDNPDPDDPGTDIIEGSPPIAHASDITGHPQTMYADTVYSVTCKYFHASGRDSLKHCLLQLDHPTKPLTMMWYQSTGIYGPWAGEEGANYLTITDVNVTEIANGNEGYELTWSFKISDQWPEVENAIDFGVFAGDDGDLISDWDYDDTNASFSTEPALNCVVQLWPISGPGSIGVVSEDEEFLIYVGGSTGDIAEVYFLGDASVNGSPDGDWTGPFGWNTDSLLFSWDYSAKTKEWAFNTGGGKEVWCAIMDGDGNVDTSYAYILVEPARVPVIIIPGIMGSELWKVESNDDRERIWPEVAGVSLQDADNLALTPSGGDQVGVNIQEGDILRKRIINAGWLDGNIYGKLIERLTEGTAGYVEGIDLFVFPYDWRKELGITSVELAKRISAILAETGAGQVDIVAHSMGGLVARHYINSSSMATVRKLVLMATPSHGSPDALKALHSELGRGPGLLSDEEAQDLSANWPSAYQLLPTEEYFNLYGHIFVDLYGPRYGDKLVAASPAETWDLTYVENEDSSLKGVNSYLLTDATFSASAFHKSLGPSLEFFGETYIIAGSGSPTTAILVKQDLAPIMIYPEHTWYAIPSNGDQTVPLLSVTRLDTSGSLRIFHVDVEHKRIPNDENVRDLVLAILQGDEAEIREIKERRAGWLGRGAYEVIEEQSLLDGSNEDQAHSLEDTSIIVIKSPVELHIYNSEGNHIGPDGDGFIETAYHTDYFMLGSNTIAFIPMSGTYELEMLGTATGIFGLEIMEFDGEGMTRVFSFENIEVTSFSQATLSYDPLSPEYPTLRMDANGDGSIDVVIQAEPANTPIGSNISIAFYDELITVLFDVVTSSGRTICLPVDTLDNLDPSFKPVTPFYFLSTSAEFTGPVNIDIRYDNEDVPDGREADLKLYRITGELTIQDITQQLDQAASTAAGQTDGFSYFVVGYINESPSPQILSPQTGDAVTENPCEILWDVPDPDSDDASLLIDLFYSISGGSSWLPIFSDLANTGAFDWDISSLLGGEYRLKLVAEDAEGEAAETTTGPFVISVFDGNIVVAPNPVDHTGTAFFYSLRDGTSSAELGIFNVTGRLLYETSLDVGAGRFPSSGTWQPVDNDGVSLANGPYIYVLIADGRVIGQGKLVIQR